MADASFPNSGAVNAGVGLDFDVVFENGGAGLSHLVPRAVFLFGEAEAICSDDDAVLQNDAIANTAVFAHDSVRVGKKVIADFCAAINSYKTMQNRMIADGDIFIHETVRTDVRA